MGIIIEFFGKLKRKQEVSECERLSEQRIEYLRQLVGCELYNRAEGMPVGDALAALDRIRADVERHAATGGRIV